MIGPWCWNDGQLVPVDQAVVSVDDINFAYGYGVYETLKVRKGLVYFPEDHEARLFRSAGHIGLEHPLKTGDLVHGCRELVAADGLSDSNLKVLLIGGRSASEARFWILALAPLFPDRKNYRDGGTAVTFRGERAFPAAKTLNMLVSTLAYRKAQSQGAYDALLVNHRGEITEGTRTNFFWSDGRIIFTPPKTDVLEGVTRMTVIRTMEAEGIPWEERRFPQESLAGVKGCFLTSTSTKIMPLRKVDQLELPLDPLVRRLMEAYDGYLKAWSLEHFHD